MPHPTIVSGGMGIYAFPWLPVSEVAKLGLGIVSGTGMHIVLSRLLQLGDQGGHFRRALKAFPDKDLAMRILDRYYVSEGIPSNKPFKNIEQFSLNPSRELIELTIVANFCQVWLAKEGHQGKVGVNFLEKLQMPHLYSIYGILLAEADYLIMGAGIPMQISAVLDKLIKHEEATYNIHVIGTDKSMIYQMKFNPRNFLQCSLSELKRPYFFPKISSSTLAQIMTRSEEHIIDGWVVELSSAGGHSMSPRGKALWTASGEPIYGKKDEIDFNLLNSIGLPYYMAGGYASPEMYAQARSLGAIGILVGSPFALSDDSTIDPDLRIYIRKEAYNGRLIVFNDAHASPTGFPFKVVHMPRTLGDIRTYLKRKRICDLGGLLQPYLRSDGSVGYRCPAEPTSSYCKKGGKKEDTVYKMCLCNGLFGTVGLGQRLKSGTTEPPVVTLGQNLDFLRHLMSDENDGYSIKDVFDYLLS